jgi:hypothetical protein
MPGLLPSIPQPVNFSVNATERISPDNEQLLANEIKRKDNPLTAFKSYNKNWMRFQKIHHE